METEIIYPGTFDPVTNGHADLAERASKVFSRVVVAIAISGHKQPTFSYEERISMAKEVLKPLKNVEVVGFDVLLTKFAQEQNIHLVLRGLRAVSDFEYEFQLASMNRKVYPDIETIFLTPSENNTFISANLVREMARLGGDVSQFVDPFVIKSLRKKYNL